MHALIIENEYDIPGEISAFIKENKHLFTKVVEQTACRYRPLEDITRFIVPADAIIVMSTWMYRDQLELFVQAFGSGPFSMDKKRKFYIWNFQDNVNKWCIPHKDGKYEDGFLFDYPEIFAHNLHKIVTEQDVYSIEQDISKKRNRTDPMFPQFKRYPYTPYKLVYSQELNFYYLEGTEETPEKQKEHYVRYRI